MALHRIFGAPDGVRSSWPAWATLLSTVLIACATAASGEPRFFDLSGFQVFVVKPLDHDKPYCALLKSESDWNRVFHPAAHMGFNKPFAPPAEYWRDHDLAVLSQIVSVTDVLHVYTPTKALLTGDQLTVSFVRRPQKASTSFSEASLAVESRKGRAHRVDFIEDGKPICTFSDKLSGEKNP